MKTIYVHIIHMFREDLPGMSKKCKKMYEVSSHETMSNCLKTRPMRLTRVYFKMLHTFFKKQIFSNF